MSRCARGAVAGLVAGVIAYASAWPTLAQAQQHRSFSAQVLRGELVIGLPPQVVLNGQDRRLAPGARIRGEDNLLKLPASLSGQRLVVHYTVEASTGLLADVWILNPTELANKRWPTSEADARSWRFDPSSQIWHRP